MCIAGRSDDYHDARQVHQVAHGKQFPVLHRDDANEREDYEEGSERDAYLANIREANSADTFLCSPQSASVAPLYCPKGYTLRKVHIC